MRSTLLGLLVGSATCAFATKTGCTQGHLKEVLFESTCGDFEEISTCLAGTDIRHLSELETCFNAGGCDSEYAVAGAKWFASECHTYEELEVVAELRRRADESTTEKTAAQSTKKTTAFTDSESTTEATSTTIASTEATTTSEATTATTSSSSSASAAAVSTTLSTTTSSSRSSSTAGSTTSSAGSSSTSLVCSTTTLITTTTCSTYTTGSSSGHKTCTPTVVATETCAAGNICSTDSSNNQPVCMKRDDSLTTSGTIVTIIFAVSIGAFLIGLIVMYVQGNKQAKRYRAEREALLGNN